MARHGDLSCDSAAGPCSARPEIAGAPWPAGDEDKTWDVARAWEEAINELTALLAKIDEARQATMAAYPAGAAREEMGGRFDDLRTGEHSWE
ncbi:hypothetical protein [Nocardia sp. NPDC002869]|uniref:WXG100-like domain-containing protein n=1 Tax=Nocardia sp. NPDC002869 TaxID=3161032 RepID=UPI00398D0271